MLTTFFLHNYCRPRDLVACDKIATDPFYYSTQIPTINSSFSSSLFGTNRHRTMDSWKNYIITLKDSSTDADASAVKDYVNKIGGSIGSEFSLIKGFTAKLPEAHSASIGEHEHVASIEEDGEVKTQPI